MAILEKNVEEYENAIAEGKIIEKGLTLEGILKKYEKLYNKPLLSPREYIRQLRKEGKLISESSKKIRGKALIYTIMDNTTPKADNNVFKKYREIVMDLLDGKDISEDDYAYLTGNY